MKKLVALVDLYGDYGKASPGTVFECDDASAHSLQERGLAEKWKDPSLIERLFKMTAPPENKAIQPDENKNVAAPQIRPDFPIVRYEKQRRHGRR